MDAIQARKLVYATMATTLESDIASGAEWLHQDVHGEDLSPQDTARILTAVKTMIVDFRRKSV